MVSSIDTMRLLSFERLKWADMGKGAPKKEAKSVFRAKNALHFEVHLEWHFKYLKCIENALEVHFRF